jgi:hypothetical protein
MPPIHASRNGWNPVKLSIMGMLVFKAKKIDLEIKLV